MTSITFYFCFIPILALLLLMINIIFAPHSPYMEKSSIFECGFHSFMGQNRTQFSISFFIYAIAFLIFDLEIVLVFPYSVSSYLNEGYGLFIMLIFIAILTIGFAFEIGKKALYIETKQLIKSNTYNTIKSFIISLRSKIRLLLYKIFLELPYYMLKDLYKYLLQILKKLTHLVNKNCSFSKILIVSAFCFCGLQWTSWVKEFTIFSSAVVAIYWLVYLVSVIIIFTSNNNSPYRKMSFINKMKDIFANWKFLSLLYIVSLTALLLSYHVSRTTLESLDYSLCIVFIRTCNTIFALFIACFLYGWKYSTANRSFFNSVKVIGNLSYINIRRIMIVAYILAIAKQAVLIFLTLCVFNLPDINLFILIEWLDNALSPLVTGLFATGLLHTEGSNRTNSTSSIRTSYNNGSYYNSSIGETMGSINIGRRRYVGTGIVGGGYNGRFYSGVLSRILLDDASTDIESVTPISHNGHLYVRIKNTCGSFIEVSANQMMWFFNRSNLPRGRSITWEGRQLYFGFRDDINRCNNMGELLGIKSNRLSPLIVEASLKHRTTGIPLTSSFGVSRSRSILDIAHTFNPYNHIMNRVFYPSIIINVADNPKVSSDLGLSRPRSITDIANYFIHDPNILNRSLFPSIITNLDSSQKIFSDLGLSNGGNISDLENIIPFRWWDISYLKLVKRDGSTISVEYPQLYGFFDKAAVYINGEKTSLLSIILQHPLRYFPITKEDAFYLTSTTLPASTPNPSVRVSFLHMLLSDIGDPNEPNAFPSPYFDTRNISEIWQPNKNTVDSTKTKFSGDDWRKKYRKAQWDKNNLAVD